jgi:hypothetical protein
VEDPVTVLRKGEEGCQSAHEIGDVLSVVCWQIAKVMLSHNFKSLRGVQEEIDSAASHDGGEGKDKLLCEYLLGQQMAIAPLVSPCSSRAGLLQQEEDYVKRAHVISPNTTAPYFIAKARTHYILGRPDLALETLGRGELMAIPGYIDISTHNVIQSLSMLAMIRQTVSFSSSASSSGAFDMRTAWSVVRDNQEQMALWRQACPANFQGMEGLMQAEVEFARLMERMRDVQREEVTADEQEGHITRIISLYHLAISHITHTVVQHPPRIGRQCRGKLASSSPPSPPLPVNLWLLAIAQECFARFLYSLGRDQQCVVALVDSLRSYSWYGAVSKRRLLCNEFWELLTARAQWWASVKGQLRGVKAVGGERRSLREEEKSMWVPSSGDDTLSPSHPLSIPSSPPIPAHEGPPAYPKDNALSLLEREQLDDERAENSNMSSSFSVSSQSVSSSPSSSSSSYSDALSMLESELLHEEYPFEGDLSPRASSSFHLHHHHLENLNL